MPLPASPTPRQSQSQSPVQHLPLAAALASAPDVSASSGGAAVLAAQEMPALSLPWLSLPLRGETNGRSSCLVQDQGQKAQRRQTFLFVVPGTAPLDYGLFSEEAVKEVMQNPICHRKSLSCPTYFPIASCLRKQNYTVLFFKSAKILRLILI